jgi:mannosyltransferase
VSDGPSPPPPVRWRDLLIIAAIAALAAAWQIDRKPIWLDEAVSWDMASRPPADLAAKTAADIHPPLYYLVLSVWAAAFGDSLTGLRSLSAVATIGSAVLLYLLARRWLARGTAAFSAVAYAISPHTIYFAQEARMYALAAILVLAATVSYRRWLESGATRTADLIAYGITAAAAMYTHYATALALIAIAAHLVFVYRPGRRSVLRWVAANLGAALIYLPWMSTALAQIFRGQAWRQSVTLADLPRYAVEAIFQLEFGLYQFPHFGLWPYTFVAALAAAGLFGVAVALRRGALRTAEHDWFLVLMVVAPLLIALFAQLRSGYLSLPRYLAYLLPFVVLLLARGLTTAFRPPVDAAAVLALAALQLPALGHYYRQPTRDYDPAPVIEFLQARLRESADPARERIIFAPGYMHLMFKYYWRDMPSEGVSSPAELDRLISSSAGTRLWVVEDYRWVHGHGGVTRDDLESVAVAPSDERRVRVFRLKDKQASAR